MTKAEFKKGYTDGPRAAWLVNEKMETIYPGQVFCQVECMGEWIRANVKLPNGVVRGNMPYHLIEAVPCCAQCHRPLWSET